MATNVLLYLSETTNTCAATITTGWTNWFSSKVMNQSVRNQHQYVAPLNAAQVCESCGFRNWPKTTFGLFFHANIILIRQERTRIYVWWVKIVKVFGTCWLVCSYGGCLLPFRPHIHSKLIINMNMTGRLSRVLCHVQQASQHWLYHKLSVVKSYITTGS